ncbi:MAG TPA: sodium:solute symporter [Lentisphaeria bacterium]|uniref:sodium:solute symporter family protein n=1 Tax=Victivallis lenta TaxID=2606640 RepID=UPI000D03FBF7|nr:sodium:solute symporter [Victivallis lenta]AVM45768.1 sodium:solute symporter [Victivallales bacterium CCUG 44730]HBP06465.1 sodium:solute symporter [Lentisphaeria bacterium]HCH84671.1 sodium:solute symporter [Lentisphaeria bacterium]
MQPIDWFLFSIPIVVIAVFCFHSQKYIRSVADFLAAGRTGGRYLLSSANGMAGMGLITLAVAMQNFRHAGWAVSWWGQVITLAMTILSLSGFVYYRYRQTKVLTLAQFFEIRYCRAFRVVMGILCWLAGIINFGIFPAVGAHFFIAFLGLPREIGGIPLYPVLMVLFLGSAAVITMSGGQVQNMITDMIQSLFGYFMCVVVGISVVCIFSMEQFREAMLAQPPGQSYVNPFDSFEVSDFNIWFILINLIVMVYGYGSWQGNQGYSASALNPHEAKMGNILSTWRMLSITMFSAMISLGAYTFLTHPAFASEQLAISGELASYSAQNADQMAMPMATSSFLPAGIKGLFAAVAFFFMLSTDTTYLHSWGSIFIQDIVLPLYGRPVSARLHLLLLRLAILGVAVFGFVFSLCYRQNEYINMFQMITGTFFSAGAGCAIIGGLYWKRGTRAGAWSGVAAGAFLSLAGIVLMDARGWHAARQFLLGIFPNSTVLQEAADKCPVNGAWLSLVAVLCAGSVYVLVSLLTCRKPFNMDRMLHRGRYAEADTALRVENARKIGWCKRLFLGFDEEFTLRDKIVSVSVFSWTAFWTVCFVVITLYNIIAFALPAAGFKPWDDGMWFNWMMFYLMVHVVLAPVTAVWMTWGGIRDLREMYRRLSALTRSQDDGYVPEPRKDD